MVFTQRDAGPGIAVTIQSEQSAFRVRSITALHPSTSPPPSVDYGLGTPTSEMTGFWYELLDDAGQVMHRVIAPDPFERLLEFTDGRKFGLVELSDAAHRLRVGTPLQLLLPEGLARSARHLRMFSPGAAAAFGRDPDLPVLEAAIDVVGPTLTIGGEHFDG